MPAAIRRSELFQRTLRDKLSTHGDRLASRYAEFIKLKTTDPMQPFGSKDYAFTSDGILRYAVRGETLLHAHLLHDVIIVYSVSGRDPRVIKLYGIFKHDELGTGQPPNIKRQKQVASQIANQTQFEAKSLISKQN